MTPVEQEDSLSSLEDRVLKAVQAVTRLRQERETTLRELAESRAETARLKEDMKALQAERKQVRERIEKLLQTIDQLGA